MIRFGRFYKNTQHGNRFIDAHILYLFCGFYYILSVLTIKISLTGNIKWNRRQFSYRGAYPKIVGNAEKKAQED